MVVKRAPEEIISKEPVKYAAGLYPRFPGVPRIKPTVAEIMVTPEPTAVFKPKISPIVAAYARAEKFIQPYVKKVVKKKPSEFLRPRIEEVTYWEKKRKEYVGIEGIRAKVTRPLISYMLVAEKKLKPAYYGFELGVRKEVREKPVKIAAVGAAFFALPPVLGGLGALGRATYFAKIPAVARTAVGLGKIAKVALPTAYVGITGYRVAKEPTLPKKAVKVGRIVAGEITPMIVGGLAGAKFWPAAKGWARTIGRKYVPPEKIVPKELLIGKKAIWTAPTKKHLPLFKKAKPYVYHATAEEWAKKAVVKVGYGKRELPGLYVAPKVSVHFLRISPETAKFYGGEFFPKKVAPTIMKIKAPVKVVPTAKAPPYKVGERIFKYMWTKPVKPGVAVIPKIKPEIEAVIKYETLLGHVGGKEYYTKMWGVDVPIEKWTAFLAPTKKMIIGKKIPTVTTPTYYTPTVTYVTTPASYAAAISMPKPSGLPSKPYKPVKKVSYVLPTPSKVIPKPVSYIVPKPTKKVSYGIIAPPTKPYVPSKPYKPSKIVPPTEPYKPTKPYKPTPVYKPTYPKPKKVTLPTPLGWPTLKRAKPKYKLPKLKLKPLRPKYKPSVAAFYLKKFTVKKPRRLTGLKIRPIIIRKKKRKKKKKGRR